eukprot:scaffold3334_cov369-Prasinococcus_capsulatus_cf.AAC.6
MAAVPTHVREWEVDVLRDPFNESLRRVAAILHVRLQSIAHVSVLRDQLAPDQRGQLDEEVRGELACRPVVFVP